jgi:hypothetical protein
MATFLKLSTPLHESWSALRDLAGAYTDDKPILGAQIDGAPGKGFVGEADRLQAILDQGEFDPLFPHQTDLDSLRDLLEYLDEKLLDPGDREYFRTTAPDGVLIGMFQEQFLVMEQVKEMKERLDEDRLPLPTSGPTYNSLRFVAEIMGVNFTVLAALAVYRPLDATGAWMTPWEDILPSDTVWRLWIQPDDYMFPAWRNLAQIRECFYGRPAYQEKMKYLPNAFYHVKRPRTLSLYETGMVIAELQMLHGPLKQVEEAWGALPMGMALDAVTGNILINDVNVLRSGAFSDIVIGISDQTGGYFEHFVDIEILADVLPRYETDSPRPANNFLRGNRLASIAEDEGVSVKSTRIVAGQLPAGLSLSSATGMIVVDDYRLIREGSYDLSIQVRTFQKVEVVLDITLEILAPEEFEEGASFTLTVPKMLSDYEEGDVIALHSEGAESDATGIYMYSRLPRGFDFVAPDQITVTDLTELEIGEKEFDFVLEYSDNSRKRHTFTFTVYPDSAFGYTMATPALISTYEDDDVIGTPPTGLPEITDVYFNGNSADYPGMELTSEGVLQVGNALLLTYGEKFAVVGMEFADDTEMEFVLVWSMLEEPGVTYSMNTPQAAALYGTGDPIGAPVVHFSSLTSASLVPVAATPPAGISFDPSTGEFTVSDHTLLVAGSLDLTVQTTLLNGLEETHEITIEIL